MNERADAGDQIARAHDQPWAGVEIRAIARGMACGADGTGPAILTQPPTPYRHAAAHRSYTVGTGRWNVFFFLRLRIGLRRGPDARGP